MATRKDPEHTEHVRHSTHHTPSRGTHYGPAHGEHNKPEGHTVMGELERHEETHDSPVPSHAQRPNIALTTKAAEVASEDPHEHDFPGGGVMDR